MSLSSDINDVFDFGISIQLEETENNLGLLFDANNLYFSTGKEDTIVTVVGEYSSAYSDAY